MSRVTSGFIHEPLLAGSHADLGRSTLQQEGPPHAKLQYREAADFARLHVFSCRAGV